MTVPDPEGSEPQSARAVLMVRPASFAFNPETAASNAFQQAADAPDAATLSTVLREFDRLAELLSTAGIAVTVAEDSPLPRRPDAVFPNNWVSFHRDGSVVLYPMMAANRRLERSAAVLDRVTAGGQFHVRRTVDLSYREAQGKFLEGTGSLVLDRRHRFAYACVSPRTDLDVLGEFAQQLDYGLVTFDATDLRGTAIYHTNVMLAIGSGFAVVCGAAIGDTLRRAAVFARLRATGRDLVDISQAQMQCFAGNVLELSTPRGKAIALSTTALGSLEPRQRRTLESHGELLVADIPTIERIGGGGVRCMLAEIHLPSRQARG